MLAKDYPRPVLWRLLPRIVVYQLLWLMYVGRRGAAGAYLRGFIAGLRGWRNMRRKGRELAAKRRITDNEFVERLRTSERQIFDWQQTLPAASRSSLLKTYFALFGKP